MFTLLQELLKNNLIKEYWNLKEDIFSNPIALDYEPIGEMGIYSKSFHFELPYSGDSELFFNTVAVIDVKISSINPTYNLESAIRGGEPYHNVKIDIKRNNEYILSCKYRLWDETETEYCGKESVLKQYFMKEIPV